MHRFNGAAALLLTAVFVLTSLSGCGESVPAEAANGESTAFICRETNEVFAADKLASKTANPKTGRATLVPALYCRRCEKWYPAPPLETLQRKPGAALCPKTGEPMSMSGPLPTPTAKASHMK